MPLPELLGIIALFFAALQFSGVDYKTAQKFIFTSVRKRREFTESTIESITENEVFRSLYIHKHLKSTLLSILAFIALVAFEGIILLSKNGISLIDEASISLLKILSVVEGVCCIAFLLQSLWCSYILKEAFGAVRDA